MRKTRHSIPAHRLCTSHAHTFQSHAGCRPAVCHTRVHCTRTSHHHHHLLPIGQRRVVGLSFGSPLAAGAAGVLSVCVLLAAAAAGCRRGCVMLLSYEERKKKKAGGRDREPCVREPCVRTRVHVLVQQTPPVLQHPRGDCIKDEGYGARTWNKNNKNIKLSPRCARPKSLHVWHGRWRS